MSTKKNPRAKPAPKPASAKGSPKKGGAAKAQRPAVPPSAPPPAREATPIASESLLTLTTSNFAALRKQLAAGAGKPAHAAVAEDDNNLAEALKRLETGYRELLRRS